jgi:hypothetical protein
MKLLCFSEYYDLIHTHDQTDSSHDENMKYLRLLELGIEKGNDNISLLSAIGLTQFANNLIN